MKGHLSMIDFEKLSCKSLSKFFFCINKLLQLATLVGFVDVYRGFTTSKHWCVDIWSGFVSGYWRFYSSFWILVFSKMVSEPVWRLAPIVDRDREYELSHLHFMSFPYIFWLRGIFHCVQIAHFSQEHFLFYSKRFRFSQDTTISVRSGGIKPECALLIFL